MASAALPVGLTLLAPCPKTFGWVADITYVSTWSGWVYIAFVTDAYARMILGWRTATNMSTQLVLDAVEHAIGTRGRRGVTDLGGVVHHTDYAEAGVKPRNRGMACSGVVR